MKKVNRESSPVVIGFCRVSTARQDLERQSYDILEYANRNGWKVAGFFETKLTSRLLEKKKTMSDLRDKVSKEDVDIILFSELSRFGRSVGQIARLVDEFVEQHGVELHFIKEGMVLRQGKRDMQTKVTLTMFSLLAEIERDLISERTKSALAARRKAGVKLGRPKLKSKLDNKEEEIKGMIEMGVMQKFIAKKMDCTEATLSNWLKRKRKEWMVVNGKETEKAK